MDRISRLELMLRYVSNLSAFAAFWATVLLFTVWYPHVLGWFERLSLGAALSWAAFVNMEVMGMLIMSFQKEKWQKEARAEGEIVGEARGRAEGVAEGRKEGVAEGRAEGVAEGRKEGIAAGREEGRAEARAEYEEIIRRLERRLRERENGNGNGGAPQGGA